MIYGVMDDNEGEKDNDYYDNNMMIDYDETPK
jgi:hypothetical protein